MSQVSKNKSTETFQKGRTISRREALKRIAFGVPIIVTLGTRQNINAEGFTGIQYVLLESNLIDLKKQGAPEGLIKKLQPLQGEWFPKEKFAVEIEKRIPPQFTQAIELEKRDIFKGQEVIDFIRI